MSVEREIILTPEGYRRLKDEIDYLSTKKRDEVAERIRESRQFGDITENSEYDDAKNEQAARTAHRCPGGQLRSAKVIIRRRQYDVGWGTKVTLQDIQHGDVLQPSSGQLG